MYLKTAPDNISYFYYIKEVQSFKPKVAPCLVEELLFCSRRRDKYGCNNLLMNSIYQLVCKMSKIVEKRVQNSKRHLQMLNQQPKTQGYSSYTDIKQRKAHIGTFEY